MGLSIDALTFDCHDPRLLAEFWSEALGYELEGIDAEGSWLRDPSGRGWPLLFLIVPEGKSVKNRVHLDLRPATSMADEVERLKGLGASIFRRVDENDSFWTVMLDPEGNELCVLRGPEDGWTAPE
jgi:predicted enzyme related to lactoylglutathione lyase